LKARETVRVQVLPTGEYFARVKQMLDALVSGEGLDTPLLSGAQRLP